MTLAPEHSPETGRWPLFQPAHEELRGKSRRPGLRFSQHGWYAVSRRAEDLSEEYHHGSDRYVPSSEISPSALEGIIGLYFQKLEALSNQIAELSSQVSRSAGALKELKTTVADLEEALAERPVVRTIFLMDLESRNYSLSTPIPTVVEEYDDGAVARWTEVEATGSGATELEAIKSLKRDILDLYEDLNGTPRSRLGTQAAIALSILKATVKKKRG